MKVLMHISVGVPGSTIAGSWVYICSASVYAVSQLSSRWYYFTLPSAVYFFTCTFSF